MAVLTVLMKWPDVMLPMRFISGFHTTGVLERTGVYAPMDTTPPVSVAQVISHAPLVFARMAERDISPDAQFLWDSCVKEQQAGWASELLPRHAIDALFGASRWAPIPSFCHTQPDGKQRRIDDAKAGHQNQAAAYSEKLAMCTAFQPALNARLFWEESQSLGIPVDSLRLHAGGEDLPNAYRHVPCHPSDLPLNVVAVQNPLDRQWYYQVVYAMLFGMTSAVLQFGRWSAWIEAVSRRLLQVVLSMYVDDAHIMDFSSAQ
eukprot:6472724-Amphidinium_carterae.2